MPALFCCVEQFSSDPDNFPLQTTICFSSCNPKVWGQKVTISSRDEAINRPDMVLQKGCLPFCNTMSWCCYVWSYKHENGLTSQNPSIHGGLNELCVPTDTLTGVDGQIGEVGDTAAGLWNEYGWSLLALEGPTDGR